MGNVTDSLHSIARSLSAAKGHLNAINWLADPENLQSTAANAELRGMLLDLRVMLDDVSDVIDREEKVLLDKGSLLLYRDCGHCAGSFLAIPGAHREPLYCSGACRQAAYRARRAVTSQEPPAHS